MTNQRGWGAHTRRLGWTLASVSLALATSLFRPGTAHAWPLTGAAPGDQHFRQDLDIGAGGDVWSVGLGPGGSPTGRGVLYRWEAGAWLSTSARGTRVAVDPSGGAWHINEGYEIYRPSGAGWVRTPGFAREIDVGPRGHVWILGTNSRVYRWTGSGWAYDGELGERITVDADGYPWVVKSDGRVRRRTASGWVDVSGSAVDLDTGGDHAVYRLDPHGYLWKWRAARWDFQAGPQTGIRLAMGPTGAPNYVAEDNNVLSHFAQQIYGDPSCTAFSRDCNVCAPEVERQFRDLFAGGGVSWRGYSFGISWFEGMPPENVEPREPFYSPATLSHHWQGFVRTGNPAVPFAGTSSDDDTGAAFTVAGSFNTSSPSLQLDTIHMACGDCTSAQKEGHPSGAHALGHWVVFEDRNRLRFLDTDARMTSGVHGMERLVVPAGSESARGAGGGVGAARLAAAADGRPRYFVMTSTPGDNNPSVPNYSYFWTLTGGLGTPMGTMDQVYLGSSLYQAHPDWEPLPPGWPMDPRYSENVSVITECGTQRLYTIHTSGSEISADPQGYYRLSRVEAGVAGPTLHSLQVGWHTNTLATCYNRAAATAYVNDLGVLDLYCTEYDAEVFADGDFEVAYGYYDSCNFQCGAPTRSGCWCDELCDGYGDCCSDKVAVCGAD